MDNRYVSNGRYKKTTKARAQKEKREQQKNTVRKYERNNKNKSNKDNRIKNNIDFKTRSSKNTRSKINERQRKKIKKRHYILRRIMIVLVLILVLAGIYVLCRVDINKIPEQIQNVFKPEEKVEINKTEVKIGLNKLSNDYPLLSKSIILKELNTYMYPSIIKIDSKYNIENILVEKIQKINNKEYLLYVKNDTSITSNDIKINLEEYKKLGDKTVYNKNVDNIDKIEVSENIVKIYLKEEDPYYIYNLNIPIVKASYINNKGLENVTNTKGKVYNLEKNNSSEISFLKADDTYTAYPSKIGISKFLSLDDMVESFKNDGIDIFFTSNEYAVKLLGKHEYSLKKYKNGEAIFLFGNKNSEIFNKVEIRKALAYSINREEIIKETIDTGAVAIDLPYIYDEVKYRYDKTAGENTLLNAGWKKSSGIYAKVVNGKRINASMKLIVNEEDETLNEIANLIKSDVEDIGIKINIERLPLNKLQKQIEKGEYDLVLANINMNENPNVSYIYNYVNINDNINNKFNEINNCSSEELNQKIQELRDLLSEEVATIGIAAKATNMIYDKSYTKIENIWYNNAFSKLELYNKYEVK